ncbi:sushi, von Willebrand factor type A, EGF and pentraxin domain-containing protein 1 isoform X1, partial [Silurus meridionalis]
VCLFVCLFAVSYTNGKCGPPTRYPDKHLLEKYEGRQEFNDGDKVTYKCALGYTGQGLRVSSCNNGAWSRLDFQCKRKRCGSAGELPNGRFRHMGNELEDLVYAECSDGYVLQGDSVRKCLADGWSGTVPRCVVADVATVTFATGVVCPLLKNENATFHGAKAAYNPGETLSYSCNAGFQLNGNNSILQCGRTGQWIPSHTNCHMMPVQVTCPPPAVPNSSGQDGYKAEYEVGERAAISCQKGYRLIGSSQITCLEDGQWEELPNCHLIEDDKATYNITKDTYTDKETVSYVCNVGFRLKGRKSKLLCVNGTWKPKSAECKLIKCEKLTIPNASLNTGHRRFNTQVNISCQEGYNIKGPNVITCGGQGVWIPAPPTCVKVMPVQVTCPPPAVPNSSGQDGYKAEYEVGERAAISCQKGYRLIGSSQITCLEDGQWEELPKCHLVEGRCPPPPYVPNAHTEHNDQTDYEPNTTLRLKCNLGYRIARGPSTISCRDGQWTDVQLMCEKKRCGSAGEVENGRYHYTGSSFGDMATARCFEGYQLIGVGVRHCTNNGWDGRVAVCEGRCVCVCVCVFFF